MAGGGSSGKTGPFVTPGQGQITVSGMGTSGETVTITVKLNGTQVASKSGSLDGSVDSFTFKDLTAGTYDVTVTFNGTVQDFPGQVVT